MRTFTHQQLKGTGPWDWPQGGPSGSCSASHRYQTAPLTPTTSNPTAVGTSADNISQRAADDSNHGAFLFDRLPTEIQDTIFEKVVLDENDGAWEWVGGHDRLGHLCLPLYCTRPPILARVSRKLRADVLASLFRTTIFRVELSTDESNMTVLEHMRRGKTIAWLQSLDQRGECAIRRLQFRVMRTDAAGKRAKVDVVWASKQWAFQLSVDAGFPSDAAASASVPQPSECGVKALRLELLLQYWTLQKAGNQGMDWDTIGVIARGLERCVRTSSMFRYRDVARFTVPFSFQVVNTGDGSEANLGELRRTVNELLSRGGFSMDLLHRLDLLVALAAIRN